MSVYKIENSPVMITRAEYEELIMLRLLAQNAKALYCLNKDGTVPTYTCIESKYLLMLEEGEIR